MKINTVWAAYFSATDTTRKVVTQIARRLAHQTGAPLETFDFTLPQVRKEPKAFAEGDLVVFGTPVYAGMIVGAKAPVVVTSRADSDETKLNSIALAIAVAANKA